MNTLRRSTQKRPQESMNKMIWNYQKIQMEITEDVMEDILENQALQVRLLGVK